jgi:threonine/homoserine/homoserine lactone efflux protein
MRRRRVGALIAAFVGVALLVIVTPGQDTALTIRNSLLGGRRSGVLTAAGVFSGALLALGIVFACMTFVWLTAYAFAVARAGDVLRSPKVKRAVDAVVGTVLVAFGVRLATEPSR